MKYIAPERGKNAFTCPHCGVLAVQNHWSSNITLTAIMGYRETDPVATSICQHCNKYCLWAGKELVHPIKGNAPPPHPDMPADVKADYEEANLISSSSPKGAAALLRLAIQKLCIHLGGDGRNINDDIAKLVRDGLSPKIQQALDVVRVVGNNAVHPGQIDVDDPAVVGNLFGLLNVIVETMITIPQGISTLYSTLPASSVQGIQRRDATP